MPSKTSPNPAAERSLLSHHRRVLQEGSGIAPEVIAERGYWSASTWQALDGLAFRGTQKCLQCFPCLVIPQYDPSGQYTHSVIRYDHPRTSRDGKIIKYEQPAGVGLRLDALPRCVEGLRDPDQVLWWTEGAKKADALASRGLVVVNTPGVHGWRSPSAIVDLFGIPLKGRSVVIGYDSDVLTKPSVLEAVRALGRWMAQKGALVRVVDWSQASLPEGLKTGVDDYLVSHNLDDLRQLLVPFDRWLESFKPLSLAQSSTGPYSMTPSGILWKKPSPQGDVPVHLTNFPARIVADLVMDDGAETRRLFEIEAELEGAVRRLAVTPEEFQSMTWPLGRLGPKAVVHPGHGTKDRARAAIQLLSSKVVRRRVLCHLGWHFLQERSEWAYLHAGGAISADGPVSGVTVEVPPQLGGYQLPAPPPLDELKDDVRRSLGLLQVAPLRIMVPLLAAPYRAVIGQVDHSIHISGPTGEGKTQLASLAQQHFGPEMDAQHLPGAWSSTANASEMLTFFAKDAVVVIDDFAPVGGAGDVQRLHRDADRLLRAAGNLAGRQRLNPDGTLKPPKPPRGLILSTGEDIPKGKSLRARTLQLEIGPGDVAWDVLTQRQRDAANGLYARVMAGFIRWLAPGYERARGGLKAEVLELRQACRRDGWHRRTPEIVANLALGLRYFLEFSMDVGSVCESEAKDLWAQWMRALGETARRQVRDQEVEDPSKRFLELLNAAIASGQAHIASADGGWPDQPESWGWRMSEAGAGETRRPQGSRIGWLSGEDLYLEPDAAFGAAQAMGAKVGDSLAITPQTLRRRLHQSGFLASIDKARETLTIRRTLEGRSRSVLHLHSSTLIGHVAPDNPDSEADVDALISAFVGQTDGSMSGLVVTSDGLIEAAGETFPCPSSPGSIVLGRDVLNVGFGGSSTGEDNSRMQEPILMSEVPDNPISGLDNPTSSGAVNHGVEVEIRAFLQETDPNWKGSELVPRDVRGAIRKASLMGIDTAGWARHERKLSVQMAVVKRREILTQLKDQLPAIGYEQATRLAAQVDAADLRILADPYDEEAWKMRQTARAKLAHIQHVAETSEKSGAISIET